MPIVLVVSILMLVVALVLFIILVIGAFRPEIFQIFPKVAPPRYQVKPELRQRLLTLCNGNEALMRRLVAHARDYNRHRSANWWYEKAIADLERDRYGR